MVNINYQAAKIWLLICIPKWNEIEWNESLILKSIMS